MKLVLFFLVIIAVVAYFFYSKNKTGKQAKKPSNKVKPLEPKSQYRCVIINTGLNPCKAAQAMALQPILVNEAPILPLQTCDTSKCDCKFTRHNDRRLDNRRDNLKVTRQIIGDANNRREKKERRKTKYNYEL